MKRSISLTAVLLVLIMLVSLSGCTTAAAPEDVSAQETAQTGETTLADEKVKVPDNVPVPVNPSAVKKAVPSDWRIDLTGVRVDSVSGASFSKARTHASHYRELVFEKKGEKAEYRGMPFSYFAAVVDGEDSEHPWIFNQEAWDEGYDITLTAADGYAVTFSTRDVASDALFIADEKNGAAVPPRIVGDVSGNLQIKDLAAVELSLGGAASTDTFTLEVDINGERSDFSRQELEALPYYIEDTGSYTTSAGTTHTHLYGGIKFADFLRSYVDLAEETTVKVVAMDGYTMSYSGSDLMDESGGTWILAFKSDGDYLPLDPGYIRSIKVGPSGPNIDGHSSARMIKRVEVSAETYKEYDLLITGRMENRLDRQTIQSGVSCHKKTLGYYNRKTDETEEYTGIPLWLLLAYGDDPQHAPHRQTDKNILSYKEETAREGYRVVITAADGYSISLDSRQLNKNDDVIIATQKNGESLPDSEWPLILVWDADAELVPDGIKAVRSITEIHLLFD